jgi:hypothetical protein
MPLDPAQDDPAKPRFKHYSEPDRKLVAKRAIAQAEREAEERETALQERRQQAKVEKLRIKDSLHSQAVRKLMKPIRGSEKGFPWPKLAVVCAGLAALAVAISLSNIPLPNISDSIEGVAAPAASPEPARLFVRPALINVRADASVDAPVLTQMIRGTAVLELQRNAEWIKVALPETDGEQGWVHSSLLSTEPSDQTTR